MFECVRLHPRHFSRHTHNMNACACICNVQPYYLEYNVCITCIDHIFSLESIAVENFYWGKWKKNHFTSQWGLCVRVMVVGLTRKIWVLWRIGHAFDGMIFFLFSEIISTTTAAKAWLSSNDERQQIAQTNTQNNGRLVGGYLRKNKFLLQFLSYYRWTVVGHCSLSFFLFSFFFSACFFLLSRSLSLSLPGRHLMLVTFYVYYYGYDDYSWAWFSCIYCRHSLIYVGIQCGRPDPQKWENAKIFEFFFNHFLSFPLLSALCLLIRTIYFALGACGETIWRYMPSSVVSI